MSNVYHVATFGDFEDYCYENNVVLEIQATSLELALKCFVKHFSAEDVLGCELMLTGSLVVYTRGHSWNFIQKFGCPHVWGLLQVAEWQPTYENKWGDICYGLTQNEYNDILEGK